MDASLRCPVVDPRDRTWAKLMVERCVDVQPGWQVLVLAQPLARPLVEAVVVEIARRGAYALPRIRFATVDPNFLNEAPEEVLAEPSALYANDYAEADCYIAIVAPENTREGSEISREPLSTYQVANRPHTQPFMADAKAWVGC